MRKSKYDKWMEAYGEEYLRRSAEEGMCDRDIAKDSGISERCFNKWRSDHEAFAAALKLGRAGADYAVVEAIYRKATGYKVKVNKTYKLKHADYDSETGKKIREYEELTTREDESYIPPDVRAGSFWLKNRQPDRWSDKPDPVQEAGEVEIPEADMLGPDNTADSDE